MNHSQHTQHVQPHCGEPKHKLPGSRKI